MAGPGTWKLFTRAKRLMGTGGAAMTAGGVTLGVGVYKIALHKKSASANLLKTSNGGISTWASIGSEIVAQGGYAAAGRNIGPVTGKWTVDGTSTAKMKFTFTTSGIKFTANAANLSAIKYAVLRTSSGAGVGKAVCFCTLSSTTFSISSGNILQILPATGGIFSLK